MPANFPGSLDTDGNLYTVVDGVTDVAAAHHNNLKDAVKAIEAKLGVNSSVVPTSLDALMISPTLGHDHGGATTGKRIAATAILQPSGAVGTGLTLYDHMFDRTIHSRLTATGIASVIEAVASNFNLILVPSHHSFLGQGIASIVQQPNAGQVQIWVPSTTIPAAPTSYDYLLAQLHAHGAASVGTWVGGVVVPRNLILESIQAVLLRAPSGATLSLELKIGPTAILAASPGLKAIFAPGATQWGTPSPLPVTYPSGAAITMDVTAVGSSDPGGDIQVTFCFRR